MLNRVKLWAKALKRDVVALWIAARDRRTPWPPRICAGMVAAYALGPIDLIPDFIPILGYVDDLLIVPTGIALTIRLMPAGLMNNFRREAALQTNKPTSIAAAYLIAIIWFGAAAAAGIWIWSKIR